MDEKRWGRFSENIQEVLDVAKEEATRYGWPHLGTEHLLLALARVRGVTSARVLDDLGVSLERLRAAVDARVHTHATDVRTDRERRQFRLSFHLRGDHLPLEEIATLLELTPSRIGRKGEPFYPGRPDLARLSSHAWAWEAPATSSQQPDGFEELLAPLLTALEAHRAELHSILATPEARGWLTLSFSGPTPLGFAKLSAETVRRIGSLGLAITLHLHPPRVIDDKAAPLPAATDA